MTSASTSFEPPSTSKTEQAGNGESKAVGSSNEVSVARKLPAETIQKSTLHGYLSDDDQVTVIMSQTAIRQLENHYAGVLESELGGALLGKVERQDTMNYVLVNAALPVHSDDYGPGHFKFTADAWAQLHQDKTDKYSEFAIVGWYHTHPRFGVFYSADDVIVHSAAFVQPWHVGLVIDPARHEGCFFGWRNAPTGQGESGLAPIAGYYEFLDEQSESIVTWQPVSASVWQPGDESQHKSAMSDQVYVHANDWPALPPISPWWGVLLGGASLILTLLLLLDRLLALIR